ncbi:MAG: transcriptional regulator GutM [Anaerostipes sp.]|nr:transcriptional regulator GutM [Anaerostipes sp.]MDD3747434.1 transcriptional regulator GutM [Anaerostipes sp.]
MLPVILAAVFVCISIQMFFAYVQMKNMYRAIGEMRKNNKGKQGILAMGSAKSIYSFRKGVVAAVVIDDTDCVIDYWDMKGRTVFSQLKRNEKYVGLTVDQCLLEMKTKKEQQAFESVLKQIEEVREANETMKTIA